MSSVVSSNHTLSNSTSRGITRQGKDEELSQPHPKEVNHGGYQPFPELAELTGVHYEPQTNNHNRRVLNSSLPGNQGIVSRVVVLPGAQEGTYRITATHNTERGLIVSADLRVEERRSDCGQIWQVGRVDNVVLQRTVQDDQALASAHTGIEVSPLLQDATEIARKQLRLLGATHLLFNASDISYRFTVARSASVEKEIAPFGFADHTKDREGNPLSE